jgi:DNA-binding NarL/FixJ family response regulator
MFDTQTTNEAIAETTAIQQSDLRDVPATTLPATSQLTPEDTVTISATAADLAQPTAIQVLLLYSEGESVQTIAHQLAITPLIVRDYLGIATQAATA